MLSGYLQSRSDFLELSGYPYKVIASYRGTFYLNRTKSNLPGRFDPFSDRMARDIRNSLSEAFVAALAQKKRSVYQKTAGTWLNKNLSQTHVHYIRDRLRRYGRVFKQINDNQLNDAWLQTLLIWNKELFFEVHDHLETIWARTSGDEHQALKGKTWQSHHAQKDSRIKQLS